MSSFCYLAKVLGIRVLYIFVSLFLKRTLESRNRSNASKINPKFKTLIIAFLLLFSYLDTLPNLYHLLM